MAKSKRISRPSKRADAAADPVIRLAAQLRDLWHAQEMPRPADDTSLQLDEWLDVIEKNISFTLAESVSGAAVQLALVLDKLDDLKNCSGSEGCEQKLLLELERLVSSALRAILSTDSLDRVAHSITDVYCAEAGPGSFAGTMSEWGAS